jgi:Ni2+-binding GTPase involved in maturation of urease and hydrogenase
MNTKIILAGGFLGAGKTTLLWKTAQNLIAKGLHAGLITNDQAPELVDSALLRHEGLTVAEVSGSCFCCNFDGFVDAAGKLAGDRRTLDVIIAEPVGSCTDLTATVVRPLKKFFADSYQVAPLTVLADPMYLSSILKYWNTGLCIEASYIYRKQLEECDIILITKTSHYAEEFIKDLKRQVSGKYPSAKVMSADSITGKGLEEWIEAVMNGDEAGKRFVQVDYDIYAIGEAALGWLNGVILLRGDSTNWDDLSKKLLTRLAVRFKKEKYPIGHVKIITENGDKYLAGNLTGMSEDVNLHGSAGAGGVAKMTINARVATSPENLDFIIKDALANLTQDKFEIETLAWRCLSPGRPNPTYRLTETL